MRGGAGRAWALAALLLASAGCARGVPEVRIDDPRLPVEARRWVADAEDGVTIARAWRDRAAAEAGEAAALAGEEEARAAALRRAGAADPAARLEAVAAARRALAARALAAAEAELALAEARRARITAETAVRHDLGAVDLAPLRAAEDAALAEVRARRAAQDDQRQALEEAATAWWRAYGAWVATSGQGTLYWTR